MRQGGALGVAGMWRGLQIPRRDLLAVRKQGTYAHLKLVVLSTVPLGPLHAVGDVVDEEVGY